MTVLVTGAGGFIGHHLVKYLKARGETVRGVDIKEPEFEPTAADEFKIADLREHVGWASVAADVEEVYHLAADMGGIGYITADHAGVSTNNALMNLHMLDALRIYRPKKVFFASSACVYPDYRQDDADVTALKESDAHPAAPEEGYGWEKLFMEKLCQWYREDFGLETRVARFHNVYGPLGTYDGGKEKAPAALCRKIALAPEVNTGHLEDAIEVWGDGEQTRSFMYIDDCVEGIVRIMESDYTEPLNLGSDRLVTINELIKIISRVSGKAISKYYNESAPQGVRGRNSDNTLIREVLGWEPSITLEEGLAKTYSWIEEQVT